MSDFGLLLSSMPLISTDGISAQQILDKVFMKLDDTGYISTTWVFFEYVGIYALWQLFLEGN